MSEDEKLDSRITCKYGIKCYQKNPLHHQKYKHPPNTPKRDLQVEVSTTNCPSPKRLKLEDLKKKQDSSDTMQEIEESTEVVNNSEVTNNLKNHNEEISTDIENKIDSEITSTTETDVEKFTSKEFDKKEFIKSKFLLDMPDDFYKFWNFCKTIKSSAPSEAFKDVNLLLVGPYDVLADKFTNIPEIDEDKYLTHWRYFYDPPEFQTVIKGDDKTGFHIGYFRDSPEQLPIFLATNCCNNDGVFYPSGDNIFAAVYLYLQDLKKSGDPFKKMRISKLENLIKEEALALNLSLSKKTSSMSKRDLKVVTKTFNKVGIVVPYNKKTQLGYRELAMNNKELKKLLDKILKAVPEQMQLLLSELQPVITYASIAVDECDFGTGLELGLNILAHGVKTLNATALRFLVSSYKLLNRDIFAEIAQAHLKERKEGTNLSII